MNPPGKETPVPTPDNCYMRHRPVREEWLDDALFLIDEEGKAIHMLEGASPGVWNLLSEPTSCAEAKTILKTAFPLVSPKRIARDVETLFSDLEDAGLIRHVR